MKSDLKDWLRDDLDLYERLSEAASEQLACLQADDTGKFKSAAGKRTSIQRQILRIEDNINRAFEQAPELRSAGEVRDSRGKIEKIIQGIVEVDLQAASLAAKKRDETAAELSRLKKGRDGVKGYAGHTKARPRFIDRQG